MNLQQDFEEKNLYASISVLGSEEKDLPVHLWEELKSFCEDRNNWAWNTFEKILTFMNNWIIQYNKSLALPVLVSVSAVLRANDRSYYVLSDSNFGCMITNGELLLVGQRIMQSHQDSVLNKREVLIPQTLLGGFDYLPAHIYDEVINGEILIFSQGVDILRIRTIFEDSGKEIESFCNLLRDNGIKFIGRD